MATAADIRAAIDAAIGLAADLYGHIVGPTPFLAEFLEEKHRKLTALLAVDGVELAISDANPRAVEVGGVFGKSYVDGVSNLCSQIEFEYLDEGGLQHRQFAFEQIVVELQKEFERATGKVFEWCPLPDSIPSGKGTNRTGPKKKPAENRRFLAFCDGLQAENPALADKEAVGLWNKKYPTIKKTTDSIRAARRRRNLSSPRSN